MNEIVYLILNYEINIMIMNFKKWFIHPVIRVALSVLSGLSFFLLCMILPLVGPAGSRVEHTLANQVIFVSWLIFTLLISILSFFSRKMSNNDQNKDIPLFSILLIIICVVIFVLFLLGALSI